MMKIKALVTVLFLLHALANHAEEIGHATENVMKQGLEVSYDHRALIIDGQRRILISGSIHYPRSTPEMWPDLIAKAKDGGLDVIQTYVFWNGHEPVKGTYYFEGRYDLVQFVKVVKAAGLYVNLRIGPYVCAEWNFGGFPVWLRHIPGIAFRTNNEQFKNEMQGFVQKVVALMQQNELFAEQGGPIILAQIENEYGNIDSAFGEGGHEYMLWAASLVETLNTTIPWIMCDQADAPANIINTCNGYYCDGFVPNADNKPTIWTENWAGWFQVWEGLKPHRPAEDVAFAVARFYQRGGSFQNYYMYHGGTNFGRTSGGPFITTSYDYDAPLDEYGNKRQPKWGHLKDLHRAIKMTEPALVASDTYSLHVVLSEQQEVYVYSDVSHAASIREILAGSLCAAYISNQGVDDVTVTFNGHKYDVPGWSVTILPDCRTEVFNTAKVTAQTSRTELRRTSSSSFGLEFSQSAEAGLHWVSLEEPIGVSQKSAFSLSGLAEQIRTTGDRSDYLWYTTSVQVDETDPESNPTVLSIEDVRDGVHIFVNSKFAGRATGKGSNFSLDQPVNLTTGSNDIAVLCFTMGLQNYGAKLETWGAGIQGGVTLKGLPSGDKILSTSEWTYQVGLQGGRLAAYTEKDAQSVAWSSELPSSDQPLVWFKTRFDAPSGDDPVVINLGSMGKGQAWINGEHLGRYWVTARAPQDGCSTECDYRGAYTPAKCSSGCGEQSQTWYHVPRSWLQATSNLLVLFEEEGGNTSGIFFATSSTSSEFHSYSQASSKRSSTPPDGARLQCSAASSFHS